VASAPGFYPSRPITAMISPGTSVRIEIQLIAKKIVTETVVVTGTRTEHLQVDAPVRTDVLTTRDICERKAAVNLADALTATITGVRVENNCQNCGVTGVRLNGLESKYTQILEDGLPTMSSVAMVYALDQIPTEFVESIEVVKGGASALYGSNAVGGVINLIRREPRSDALLFTSETGWQYGRPAESVGFMGQAEKLPGSFAADYYFRGVRTAPIDRDRDGFSDRPERKDLSGGATLFRRFLDGRGRLVFGGNTLSEFRRGGDHLDLRPDQTWITEMIDTARSGGFVRWNHSLSGATFYSLAASTSYLERDTYYGTNFDPNAYGHTRNPLLATDAQIAHQAGPHMLMGGLQIMRERVQDNIPAYQRHFDSVFRNSGLYFQDEYRLRPRVTVVAGLRADKSNTLDHWVLSPRGNVRIGLGDNWNLRFGVSTGFRAPTIFDEDLHVAAVGGEGFVIQNAPNLREEKSLSGTGSLDYLGTLRGLPFQAGVNFFWTRLNDVHVLTEADSPGQDFRRFLRVNAPGSYLRGAEIDLGWRVERHVSLRGGATFQLARYRQPEPDFGSLRYFRTPARYGFAGADISLPKDLTIYVDAEFTGPMIVPHYAGYIPDDRLEESPSFAVWNLRAARTFPLRSGHRGKRELRVYGGLDNVLDTFQSDLDRGPRRDSSYVYGPRQMRTFRLGATIRF
ncbi:MAG: TonB-dependent receptor plug domain-containing protein, partial [Bryobacteraceae bacterium]